MCSHKILSIVFLLLLTCHVSHIAFAKDKPKRLIVRGDDMGFSPGINAAFERAITGGMLTSVELMVPAPYFDEAVNILKKYPQIDVGVHLVITSGWNNYNLSPVLNKEEVPSIVDENGFFYARMKSTKKYDPYFNSAYSLLDTNPNLGEIEKEVRAQIELALTKVPNISHVSAHMGALTSTNELLTLTKKVSSDYGLYISGFIGENDTANIYSASLNTKKEKTLKALYNLKDGLSLIVFHPAFNTKDVVALSHPPIDASIRVGLHRETETMILMDIDMMRTIKLMNIKLVDYRDVNKDLSYRLDLNFSDTVIPNLSWVNGLFNGMFNLFDMAVKY